MSSLKPIDAGLIVESAERTGAVVTAEDGNIVGGLGSAVAEILVEGPLVPLERVGVRDQFAESGDPGDLAEKYGLTPAGIAAAARKALERKLHR